MNGKRLKTFLITAALLAAVTTALSGCANGSAPVVPGSSYSVPLSENTQSAGGSSSSLNESSLDDTSSGVSESSSVSAVPNSSGSEQPPESAGDPSEPNSSTPETSDNSGSASGSSSPSSSAQSSSSVSTTTSEPPEPPPVVVIPDFAVPASPGIKLAAAKNGAVDYSNADQGYISAKYTGDKAKSKLQIIANGETYNFDVDVNGKTQYFPLSMGNGTYTVVLRELIEGTAASYSVVVRQEIEVNMTNPRSPYLYTNRYVSYSRESECVYKAAELCAGKSGNIEKIAAVFGWVTENVKYDHQLAATVKKTYCPDPDTTFRKKTGICFDYASLMAAMLRSQSIPTRLVIGNASPDIYHAWNEIYTEQTGWITPELLLKNNGYNLVDATFYSSAQNKQQIADYISNTANYYSIYYY